LAGILCYLTFYLCFQGAKVELIFMKRDLYSPKIWHIIRGGDRFASKTWQV
jgi:hypothetical protein